MKPLMLPDQKKRLTLINDQMIAEYLQNHEVKVFNNPYDSGLNYLECRDCSRPWDATFHKLKSNKVSCPKCYNFYSNQRKQQAKNLKPKVFRLHQEGHYYWC